jgi:hypothetical protein
MTKQTIKLSLAVAGLCLATMTAQAQTVTLLDENFNDVTGMNLASTVRAVQSVLTDTPNPLPGALWSASSGASVDNVGIRRTDNNINVNLSNSFGSFFPVSSTNKFLVMGDQVGPNTGVANAGIFGFALPFSTVTGTASFNVSFDWAFAGDDTSLVAGVEDLFKVGIAGNGFSISNPMSPTISLLSQTSPNTTGFTGFNSTGQFNSAITLSALPATATGDIRYLVIGLSEHTNTATNSAIGIDNIKITANVAPVPVPGAVWLFGSALVGFISVSRRNKSINNN